MGGASDEEIDRIVWSRPPDVPGLERMRVEGCRKLFRVFHERYAVTTALRHGSEWVYRRVKRLFLANEVALMEPGEVHYNTRVTGPGDADIFFIDPSRLSELANEAGLSAVAPHLSSAQPADPALFHTWGALASSLDRPSTSLERQGRFTQAVALLLRHAEKRRQQGARRDAACARRARSIIGERIEEDISLDELAAAVGVSRFHLVHTFRREFGAPPHAFQLLMRVERAGRAIRAGTPPAEAAARFGFADQAHFSRHFRRVWGVPPGRYARAKGS